MHHHFGSPFLIDALHCHGFCCAYNEVQQFEWNAALSYNTDIPNYMSAFVQYAADNVDHNSRTLDGHNTFHGTGMIVFITPENQCTKPIPRVKVTYKDVAIVGRVPLHFHKEERSGTWAIKFENLCSFKAQNQEADLDILWKSSTLFGSPRPSWSGMMQFVHDGDHPGKSSVMFLPMIDMNPTDVSCIVWDIQAVKRQLGAEVCNHILFLHSILGCDTTSRRHGQGKANALKKFREQRQFVELARVFDSQLFLKEDVIAAGEEALIILYNGKVERSLDSLRYKRYCDKVATSSCYVHPQTLHPTSSAAKYQSLRVYYQIRQWQGTEVGMSPQDWGWKESDGALFPVTTDLDPAPNDLLQIVRCNCQTDCSTLRCSCRKHGLYSSVACGNCRGSGCCNSNPEMDLEDETEQLSV